MMTRFIIVTVSLLFTAGIASAPDIQPQRIAAALQTANLSAKDLKAIDYVENAHGQLEEWTDRLFARLERGLGPRESDPMIDGRARFQVKKLRVTYAGYAPSPELTQAIEALALAHERRLDAVDSMLRQRVDRELYSAASADVDTVIAAIRNWRAK